MRVLIAIFSIFAACYAYDAVLFSNQREIGGIKIEKLVKGATPEEPIVFIVNPDFTLGQFSVKANAYSAEPTIDFLAKSVKNSNFHESQYFPNQIEASTAQVITSADQYNAGASIYILAGEEWTSMEQISEQLISKIDNAIGVLTSTDAVSHEKTNRVKRVATDEMDAASASSDSSDAPAQGAFPFPLILPPYNNTKFDLKPSDANSCLFYLEGISVVVQQKQDKTLNYAAALIPGSNLTYAYAGDDVKCVNGSVGEFLFRLRLTLTQDISGQQGNNAKEGFSMKAGDQIDLKLNITGDLFGYWSLTGAQLVKGEVTGRGNFKSGKTRGDILEKNQVQYSKINSVAGWSLVCGQTQALFFPTDNDNVQIGIALVNTQIQTFNIQNTKTWKAGAHFTLQTEDCTGTFSAGSWMGIVSALVLVSGLIFGYVMLQSVQTMDRFDDPKQKQIVINVRE